MRKKNVLMLVGVLLVFVGLVFFVTNPQSFAGGGGVVVDPVVEYVSFQPTSSSGFSFASALQVLSVSSLGDCDSVGKRCVDGIGSGGYGSYGGTSYVCYDAYLCSDGFYYCGSVEDQMTTCGFGKCNGAGTACWDGYETWYCLDKTTNKCTVRSSCLSGEEKWPTENSCVGATIPKVGGYYCVDNNGFNCEFVSVKSQDCFESIGACEAELSYYCLSVDKSVCNFRVGGCFSGEQSFRSPDVGLASSNCNNAIVVDVVPEDDSGVGCSSDLRSTCDDGSEIVVKRCVSGNYVATNVVCGSKISFYEQYYWFILGGVALLFGVVLIFVGRKGGRK